MSKMKLLQLSHVSAVCHLSITVTFSFVQYLSECHVETV